MKWAGRAGTDMIKARLDLKKESAAHDASFNENQMNLLGGIGMERKGVKWFLRSDFNCVLGERRWERGWERWW